MPGVPILAKAVGKAHPEVYSLPVPVVLAQEAGIDGTTQAETNLYTVPTGFKCVVLAVLVRVTAATSANGDMTCGVGIAAGASDIVPGSTPVPLDTADTCFPLSTIPFGKFVVGVADDVIKLGVDNADSGTTLTLSAELYGYLVAA